MSSKQSTRKPVKTVVEIWQNGGPSQLESFDPKPSAPKDYNDGLKSIKTNTGAEVHEWLPELAKCADIYSMVRTLTHPFFGHEKAAYLMQTGHAPGGALTYPAIGTILSSMMKTGYAGDLPPFVILTQEKGRFSDVGFFGDAYAPLVTGGNPAAKVFEVDGIVPPGGLTRQQIDDRFEKSLLMDHLRLPKNAAFDKAGELARNIIRGPAAETFDLTREKKETREKYGMNYFGQRLLAERELLGGNDADLGHHRLDFLVQGLLLLGVHAVVRRPVVEPRLTFAGEFLLRGREERAEIREASGQHRPDDQSRQKRAGGETASADQYQVVHLASILPNRGAPVIDLCAERGDAGGPELAGLGVETED